MVNLTFIGVSADKGNLTNFATEIKNEVIMNAKEIYYWLPDYYWQ